MQVANYYFILRIEHYAVAYPLTVDFRTVSAAQILKIPFALFVPYTDMLDVYKRQI